MACHRLAVRDGASSNRASALSFIAARREALVATVSCDGNGEGAGVEYAEDGVTVGQPAAGLST